ncbi:cellulose biosynthesis protein BcsN [Aureimonas sp. ME7]|uniref:cellulose biosynthesis protein BcsN n=1 Tax=Aureimonas sp. ME7 TaxID=2744252 RepID=UPI0015F5A944|nr:cellulose biosynthesis protein BcsN [Aureimonas sp. ME7]
MSVLLILSGCAGRGEIDRFSAVRDVSPREAFVLPPAGGPSVVGVLEQRYSNGVEQEIVLSGGGGVTVQNAMRVQFIGPVDTSTSGRTPLSERSLAVTNISAELRQEFPGVAMRRSALYVQNRYGPFGYASGRLGNTTCVYAWQRMSGTDHATLLLRPRGIINMRLRLCAAGASENELLATMYGLGINAFLNHFSWVPYGAPPSPSPELGETGAPIYPEPPVSAGLVAAPADVLVEDPPAPAVQPVRRRPPVRRAAPAAPAPVLQPLPAPIGPAVPPPPGASVGGFSSTSPAAMPGQSGGTTPLEAGAAVRPVVPAPVVCADGRLKGDAGC